MLFHLPLRQTQGFLNSIFRLMGSHLESRDHTTLSRRSKSLKPRLRSFKNKGPFNLILDSTGLSIFGEGEGAAAKHRGRGIQGCKKLHLAIDSDGMILAHKLTERTVDDSNTGVRLIEAIKGKVRSVTADAGYDSRPIYEATSRQNAKVIVPPTRKASINHRRCPAREKTIRRVKKIGRRRWKRESGYHQQAKVKNTFFRHKTVLGDRLRARHPDAQATEVVVACNILNSMRFIGRPKSIRIEGSDRWLAHDLHPRFDSCTVTAVRGDCFFRCQRRVQKVRGRGGLVAGRQKKKAVGVSHGFQI